MVDLFWLNDAQWAAIEPHIPKVYRASGASTIAG